MKYLLPITVLFVSVAILHAKSNSDPPQKANPHSEAMAGQKLSANQAGDLEALVAKNPDDLSTRTKLLGYYFAKRYTANDAKEAGRKHILWIIKNHPDDEIAGAPFCTIDPGVDPDGYHDAKQLWADQTKAHPKDAAILGHAAEFLLLHDRDASQTLLKQAQLLEPKNPQWSDQLAHLYALERGKRAAVRALVEYEKAQSIDTSDISKFSRLDQLAKTAYDAQEFDKASRYAEELLKSATKNSKNWNYGNAVHHGNNVLGRIALKKGDVKQADEFLLKAGQTPGSPQLDSFGPNMSLAKELLEAGEKETVLQYFKLCRKFWSLGGERLDDWSKQVTASQVPDFGANLVF